MCLGNEEGFQLDVCALEECLEVFDAAEELDLWVVEVVGEVAQTLRIKEGDGLFVFAQEPENEVWTKACFGEEADALVGAVVAKEVKLRLTKNTLGFGFAEGFEVIDELLFTFVEMCWHDLNQCLLCAAMAEVNQRLVQLAFS